MLLAFFLVIFLCIGVANIIDPDWLMKRSGVRKGGEMLASWNRFGFRLAGAVFAGFAVYLLYVLLRN